MRLPVTFALAALLWLGACATGPKFGALGSYAEAVEAGNLPAPTLADYNSTSAYFIGPFDRLAVQVFKIPELTFENLSVGADGMLSYPLLGSIRAGGLTTAELEDRIESGLRARYVRDPDVSIRLVETISQVVTIEGQVAQPGKYPVVGEMSLLGALATARGLRDNAKTDAVVVMRTVNGRKMAALYNLNAIRRGVYEDPRIYPRDVVVVDRSVAAQYFRDALQVFSTLTYPLITLLP